MGKNWPQLGCQPGLWVAITSLVFKVLSRPSRDEHITRMDAERLVKISRDNIPARRRSPGRPKRRWSDLIPGAAHNKKMERLSLHCAKITPWFKHEFLHYNTLVT